MKIDSSYLIFRWGIISIEINNHYHPYLTIFLIITNYITNNHCHQYRYVL